MQSFDKLKPTWPDTYLASAGWTAALQQWTQAMPPPAVQPLLCAATDQQRLWLLSWTAEACQGRPASTEVVSGIAALLWLWRWLPGSTAPQQPLLWRVELHSFSQSCVLYWLDALLYEKKSRAVSTVSVRAQCALTGLQFLELIK